MDNFIWPRAELETLFQHPQPTVQEWAVATLFQLYPQRGSEILPQLLGSQSPSLVQAALARLGKSPRRDLVPLLQELYVRGAAPLSAGAIRVLGDWRIAEAATWMQERIFMDPPLEKQQILAMIYALGRLPGEEAYQLLKHTEAGIEGDRFNRWDLFYAALLQHRRSEDVATLLQVIRDEERTEERRRDALGLLLAQLDPGLNPGEVFFSNHPAVQHYLQERLRELSTADTRGTRTAFLEALGREIRQLGPESIAPMVSPLQKMLAALETDDSYEKEICNLSLQLLTEYPGTDRWCYGLAVAAVCAVLAILQQEISPPPPLSAPWPELLDHLLANRPLPEQDESYQVQVLQAADRNELTARLVDTLNNQPGTWGAMRALDMLGKLQAVSAARSILHSVRGGSDDAYRNQAQTALIAMGAAVIPLITPFLTASPAEKAVTLGVLGTLPTQQGIQAILERLPALYDECPEAVLDAAATAGSDAFLAFLEGEYRSGSWELAQVYVQLCRIHQRQPRMLREIEQDLQRSRELEEENRRLLRGESARWPDAVYLELACGQCAKRYTYAIHELHLHPQPERRNAPQADEMAPYKHGVVIVDDLHCKNCDAVNDFVLTEKSLSQLTTESIKLMALQKGAVPVPGHYPLKHVQVAEKDSKPLSLADVEQEHLNAVRLSGSKPAAQLALGKFYEYVKRHRDARHAYLRALDLDAQAVEAMAGLARLSAVAEQFEEALQWIESCYDNLDKGRLFLADDAATFKKVVREKRREFARKLGVKAEDKEVEVRFRVDSPDYPKNRPCPCGSGKKYKLCCMKS